MGDAKKALEKMDTLRVEAFSDGVMAIIITIMVLEIKTPEDGSLQALKEVSPTIIAYLFSFLLIGIYWNNHHHLLRAANRISHAAMWSNLHLLFWLSLTPFVTGWVGKNPLQPWPVAFYGFVGLGAAVSYFLLTLALARANPGSKVEEALSSNSKDKISHLAFLSAIPFAFLSTWISFGLMALVITLWIIPDKRFT